MSFRAVPIITIIAWMAAAGLVTAAPPSPRPNIVLIMADDFGFECVTANGGESYRTPNLDRLAATGLRFTQCYVQPLCTPTRVELMTGRSNVRNYVRFGMLPPDERTFANVLKDAGYATGICGKWQLGRDRELPRHFGFDESYLWQHTRRPPRYANPGLEVNGIERDFKDGEYGPSLVNDFALDFIERHADAAKSGETPFLLYYPMMLTHHPFQPTPDSPDWDPQATGEKANDHKRHFADMTAFMDKLIGRLVDTLDRRGLRENTLILFLGDNGTGGGVVSRFNGSDFKGGKGQTTHRGMHVPGIANWPGRVPPGRVCDDLVTAVDFLPTICEVATVAEPSGGDGISFAPQLRGERGTPREWIYSWYSPWYDERSDIREFAFDQRHKLYADGTLFELSTDPDEERPLRSESATGAAAAAAKKLRKALDRFAGARPAGLDRKGDAADEQKVDGRPRAGRGKRKKTADGRPNILWLAAEDTSASSLRCYGTALARTPTLDSMAAQSIVFDRCFTNPVCAPSRFTLITGVHAASCGPAHHMRAQGRIPDDLTGFPALLRSAGYYTTNNAKTDYNSPIDPKQIWNESGKTAHYRNRPDPDQPFFAVFNHEVTHESCLFPEHDRDLPVPPTDPATVRIPPYQPDTPEMRADWARQTDRIAWLDRQIQEKLDELETAGLADDTVVFFFGDNGGVTPRSKRFLQASGTRVPLIVHFPPKWRHLAPADPGTRSTDPVGFVDFAPTVLAIAGVPAPPRTQGRPFAGPAPRTNEHVFCTRDRMDERYDMSRSVMDRRWLYIRHFRPDIPYVQPLDYQFRGRGYQSWARAARDGSLTPATARYWGRKPAEELYDLEADPDNVTNLAADPAHRDEVARLRAALRRHMVEIHDNGLLPEGSSLEGYDQSRDSFAFPVERVCDLAVLASEGDAADLPVFVDALDDPSEPIRWWAAQGCTIVAAGHDAAGFSKATEAALQRRLTDDSMPVRVAAAEALVTAGSGDPALSVLEEVLRSKARSPTVHALNAFDRLGERARPSLPSLKEALADAERTAIPDNAPGGRTERYGRDLLAQLIAVLEGKERPLVYPDLR